MVYPIFLVLNLFLFAFGGLSAAMVSQEALAPHAFHANAKNKVYYAPGFPAASSGWTQIDGALEDVAVADDGQVIGVGTNNSIYYSSGVKDGKANWKKQKDTWASRVAAAGNRFMYIGKSTSMYYFEGKAKADGSMEWIKLNGTAKIVSIGSDGQMFVLGTNNVPYFGSKVENKKVNWIKLAGIKAKRTAISNDSAFMYIGEDNAIYYFKGSIPSNGKVDWTKLDGSAKEVAFGPNGSLYCIGMDDAIYSSDGVVNGKANWKKQTGTSAAVFAFSKASVTISRDLPPLPRSDEGSTPGVVISRDIPPLPQSDDGSTPGVVISKDIPPLPRSDDGGVVSATDIETAAYAFHANAQNKVYYAAGFPATSSGWTPIDGALKDVAVADDGQVIGVGTNNSIYHSSGVKDGKANWKKQKDTWASRVAAAGNRFMYIGKSTSMYYFEGKAKADGSMEWIKLNGTAKIVSIGSDGQMFVLGTNNVPYFGSKVENKKVNWIKLAGIKAKRTAISNDSAFMYIGEDNAIYYFKGSIPSNGKVDWTKLEGSAKEVAFGPNGSLYCIGMDDAIYSSDGVVNGKANWKKQAGTSATVLAFSKGGVGTKEPAVTANIPAGFVKDVGSATVVACGTSVNGDPAAYTIGLTDKKVYKYDPYSFSEAQTWVLMTDQTAAGETIAKFKLIYASSDGDLVALSADGRVFEYDFGVAPATTVASTTASTTAATTVATTASAAKSARLTRARSVAATRRARVTRAATTTAATTTTPATTTTAATTTTPVTTTTTVSSKDKWVEITGTLKNITDIAIGADKLVAVGGDERGIYQHNGTDWVKLPTASEAKNARGVAIGKDGVVFALNDAWDVLVVKDGRWVTVTSAANYKKIYAGDKDHVIVIQKGNIPWLWNSSKGAFERMKGDDGKDIVGWGDAAINAYGMIFMRDHQGRVCHNEEKGVPAATTAPVVTTTTTTPATTTTAATTTPATTTTAATTVTTATTPATTTTRGQRATRTSLLRRSRTAATTTTPATTTTAATTTPATTTTAATTVTDAASTTATTGTTAVRKAATRTGTTGTVRKSATR